MIIIGQKVKDFELLDFKGIKHTLSEHLGKKVLIYFYPKDNTPGCTTQACSFRDYYEDLKQLGVVIYGISGDDSKSHEKFVNKYSLPFVLLTDEDFKVSTYFKAYDLKTIFGVKKMGIIRSTFLIDEKGNLEYVWKPAKAKTNAEDVYNYLTK